MLLIFLAVQVVALPANDFTNDSYRYDLFAREFLGQSESSAILSANADFCAEQAKQQYRLRLELPSAPSFPVPAPPRPAACRAQLGDQLMAPNQPDYMRIFSTRPGYPLIAAPLVAVLGGPNGLRVTSILLTGLAGILVFATLRLLGGRRRVAALGQVLYYVTPAGLTGVHPLSEGPALFLLTACLYGVTLCTAGRRPRAGGVVLAASFAALGLVRYADELPLAAAGVAGAALCLLFARREPQYRRGVLVVGGVSLAALVAILLASAALGLPSVSSSLQDLFADHFTKPAVPDPWSRLFVMNRRFWTQWLEQQALAPLALAAFAATALGLRRVPRLVGLFALGCALVGVAAVVVHPLIFQTDRLLAPVWPPVAIGVPLFLAALLDRRSPAQPTPTPARTPVAGASARS